MKRINVSIDDETYTLISRLARLARVSRSELVRQCLEHQAEDLERAIEAIEQTGPYLLRKAAGR